MRTKINILLLCMVGVLNAQTYDLDKDFTVTELPTTYKESLRLGYGYDYTFKVSIKKGSLDIQRDNLKRKDTIAYKVPKGRLIGVDAGEFGGGLFFVNRYTKTKSLVLAENTRHIFKYKKEICVFCGYYQHGALFTLQAQNNKYENQKRISFDSFPLAYSIFDDRLYVVTYRGFYVVEGFEVIKSEKDLFWLNLYPTSVAILDDENIFIGMRSGIVKFNSLTDQITFYKFNHIVLNDSFYEWWNRMPDR